MKTINILISVLIVMQLSNDAVASTIPNNICQTCCVNPSSDPRCASVRCNCPIKTSPPCSE
uniref:Venom peptide Pp18a n=1 Tax=Pristhesancus plagipennis TaxID=1955184 RepID=A0A2K8JLJ4_PRIPG|nr:venom peptide Pp18a [Pristhesancus plagipennis]